MSEISAAGIIRKIYRELLLSDFDTGHIIYYSQKELVFSFALFWTEGRRRRYMDLL